MDATTPAADPSAVVRIAIAGAGLIGRAHLRRVLDAPGAALAGIADPSPAARDLAADLGVPWAPDVEALLSDAPRPDGLVVATPNHLHVAGGLAAVAAGVPALVEKPLADTAEGARRLVEAAEAAGVPLQVGHHRRHSPAAEAAREAVRSGRLGTVVAAAGLCLFRKPDRGYFEGAGAWRARPGGGVVLINLVHVVDDLRHLLGGEVEEVRAMASNGARGFAVEDTAVALLRFSTGALATITASDRAAAPWSWELTSGEDRAFPRTGEAAYLVAGTRGSLAVPSGEAWSHAPTPEGAEGHWWTPIRRERATAPEGTDADPLARQMRRFLAVARREAEPYPSGREGLRTLEAVLAIKRAAETGGTVRPSGG